MSTYNFDTIIDRHHTSCEKWDFLKQKFGRDDLLAMWVADMDFTAPPEVIEVLKERVDHGIFGYTGKTESYFESIVQWVDKRHDWKIKPEWICHSPGVVPALSMAVLALTQPGDGIILQTPVYPPFYSSASGQGRHIVENPLVLRDGHFEIDFDDLEKKIDPSVKMLFLCNPHNPTGRVWTEEELRKIGEICVRHNLIIVSDEIHSDIIYKGFRHIPIASLSDEIAARTITCIAPSKTFNIAGLSTSAIIIPDEDLRAQYTSILKFLHIDSGNIFGTFALEAAYRKGEPWLEELIEYLEGNVNFIEEFLKENISSIKLIRPEGTYVPFIDCRELGLSGDELLDLFVNKARVAMNNGAWFGKGGEGFMRINIAAPRTVIKEGLERIARAVACIEK
ncbi:MAG: PatB family C-S lyase [Aminobacterium sp.]|nr:PatB family C-S lyase [Aminobacterium sp. MB27-C1]MDD2207677.1 PatB family C-S lyase [Aminobacterium sp.]MDD3426285.1 PatB family C-S lyase [Aminobacterium sp.]MDD3708501.1 PatB family C-S lyase [Aminobacterium sp.]MDD4229703.1 PatB family C-S lyase [Aminobacterium sp.]MDD4552502.1 PatB family C-S lyase [Aminobacterium sp.]